MAKDLVPAGASGDRNEISMEQFLLNRFNESQNGRNYLFPVLCFYLPMIFGLIFSVQSIRSFITIETGTQLDQKCFLASLGFLGACLMVNGHLASRVVRNDVLPGTFHHLTIRLFLAPALALVLTSLFPMESFLTTLSCIAFGVGLFPGGAIRRFSSWISKTFDEKNKSILPLSCIQGLDLDDELRLWEEGITDSQQLAVAQTQELVVKTSYGLDRIIDWKDQAFLFMYVGDKLQHWRDMHIRGILDILGLAPRYYKQHAAGMEQALAAKMGEPIEAIHRFIDTIDNDPRVHQLWQFLVSAYPTQVASPIVAASTNVEIPRLETPDAGSPKEAVSEQARKNETAGLADRANIGGLKHVLPGEETERK